MATAEPDPQVAALARELERLSRRVRSVEQLAALTAQSTADLAARVDTPADEEDEVGREPLWSWLAPAQPRDAERTRAELAELVAWLDAVYLRYPGTALASCWAFHLDVVEELAWLRQAWVAAYDGSWRLVGDWHDRQRPGVVRRVGSALADCGLDRHVERGDRSHRPTVPLASAVEQLATSYSHEPYDPPYPTTEQTREAQTHDDLQHTRTHR